MVTLTPGSLTGPGRLDRRRADSEQMPHELLGVSVSLRGCDEENIRPMRYYDPNYPTVLGTPEHSGASAWLRLMALESYNEGRM